MAKAKVVKEVQEVYDRYMWLRSKLTVRYNEYYDNCPTLKGILAINDWHEEFKTNHDKRFWREFTKAVERAKDAERKAEEVMA